MAKRKRLTATDKVEIRRCISRYANVVRGVRVPPDEASLSLVARLAHGVAGAIAEVGLHKRCVEDLYGGWLARANAYEALAKGDKETARKLHREADGLADSARARLIPLDLLP